MNHLREIIEAIDKHKMLVANQFTTRDAAEFTRLFVPVAEEAMCFDCGDCDDMEGFKTISSLSRLPYETCWFEFKVGSLVIGVLLQNTDHKILRQVGYSFVKDEHQWTFNHTWHGAPLHAQKEKGDDTIIAIQGLTQGNERANTVLMIRSYVSAFLSALHCNLPRVKHEHSQSLQNSRKKKGKKPLFSYWTLELQNDDSEPTGLGLGGGGKKRLHLRRGHPREYSPGKWTWVQPHVVGNKELGIVHKDYRFNVATTH